MPTFETVTLPELVAFDADQFDALPFGAVGFTSDDIVELYNATESRLAGLPRDSVVGAPYFAVTAQCMNNFMVAQRFADEPELDVIIDYVLTLRMRPTRVRLRLLKKSDVSLRFLLIER
ncbi:phosphonate transporter [Methylobacterium sp. BTF04]|uniref:phosphonate transporter n=1 Tax=Methylobacterium sp. BTF04 TaxID=2708300 RepID=UPI0013D638BE|nr:phosphonate transporter [Methylobacterium sp. BTF04]NEU14622.1 phosphonate transporter [Methylobacterium sp. BTF04]